jgi:hypothetical protein
MIPTLEISDPKHRPQLLGFRHFWLKSVEGFKQSEHCYYCLKGERVASITRHDPIAGPHALWLPGEISEAAQQPGALFYLCGVMGRDWSCNFHLPFQVTGNEFDTATAKTWRGQVITLTGATRLPFSADAAIDRFPDHGPKFLNCRNFQFAAQYFPES